MTSARTKFLRLKIREYLEHQPGELWRGHLELCPVQWGRMCECRIDENGTLSERERDSKGSSGRGSGAGGGQP